MKHLRKIFESKELSLDDIKDIFQVTQDLIKLEIEDCFLSEEGDGSYTIIELHEGIEIDRIGYSITPQNDPNISLGCSDLRFFADVFNTLDKAVRTVKSFDSSLEIEFTLPDSGYGDEVKIPTIIILKEHDKEEIRKNRIMSDVEFIVNDINMVPSKNNRKSHLYEDIQISEDKIVVSFNINVENDFFQNFKHMWETEVDSDVSISKKGNKIIINPNYLLYIKPNSRISY